MHTASLLPGGRSISTTHETTRGPMPRMTSYVGCSLLLLSVAAFAGASLAEMVFRCPSCTAERQAACPRLTETCAETVREPGCGCCPVCARGVGELCGVYTPRCSSGLRCYPKPDSELPLEQLVQGLGLCGHKVDTEATGTQEHREHISDEQVEAPLEQGLAENPEPWVPKENTWLGGHKETAIRKHRQEEKTKMRSNKVEESKPLRTKQLTQCQQELDQVLERISKMPFRDNRGPLEDLYALHIPNCGLKGQYNLKQCKMSLHGQRGECWCVNPHTGRQIPLAPTVRGDPNCSQYVGGPEMEPPILPQK